MNSQLSSFTHLYKLSKTLRFELKPCYETAEKIRETGILNKDTMRVRYYETMKNLMDAYHKQYIEQTLKKVVLDWADLEAVLELFSKDRTEEAKQNLETVQGMYRAELVTVLTKNESYKDLTAATPSKLIKGGLKELAQTEDEKEALKNFDGFATYFSGYQENRKNIYSADPESTAIAYRCVHENFPKFMANVKAFNTIREEMPEVLQEVTENLKDMLDGLSLEDIFTSQFYNSVLTQTGITFYNEILGGRSSEAGTRKVQGLNECLNLYFQKNPDKKALRRRVLMVPLFKQILSDRATASFVPQMFESDEAVLAAVKAFWETITHFETADGTLNVIDHLGALFTHLFAAQTSYDKTQIYLKDAAVTEYSLAVTGKWDTLSHAMFDYAETLYGDAAKPSNKKKIEQWCKRSYFTLEEIEQCLQMLPQNDEVKAPLTYQTTLEEKTQQFLIATQDLMLLLEGGYKGENLKSEEGESVVETLKAFLDAVQALYHAMKLFEAPAEYARDLSFYAPYDKLLAVLKLIIPLYNRVRNYVTQKVSEDKKYKLMFDAPTLLGGWDKNKENDNVAVLFIRDGLYYLGIFNKNKKPKFIEDSTGESSDFQKMVYKLSPKPHMNLPRVFITAKKVQKSVPTFILEGYDAGKHTKGKAFDKKFMHKLIDFFKVKLSEHPDWSTFNFTFSPTSSYEDIGQFYKEVSEQGYKLTFETISEKQIRQYVQEGQLFLFQIYNKDFAPGATGTPNLHTLYWKALFAPENLNHLVAKLNGEAELFYRPAQIKTPFKHALGEKLVNRVCNDGSTMPEPIHKEIADWVNGQQSQSLSMTAKHYYEKAIIRDVKHEIIKDRRYTEPKFKFHVPITLNANAADRVSLNERVQAFIRNNPEVKIIGLDRGERHLLYLTLIDRTGKLLKQKSFNLIDVKHGTIQQTVNYHEKLKHREEERQGARKNWKQIGAIKDLKEGYLSIVIHEIVKMMIEENAIIVLEDLNFGFKRGRFAVERQVYQKFEKMLIDKLNYLAFKHIDATAPGGILNAYQLTDKFESFQKLNKQSGFLFYIPAAYTSKIDPTTGFVNLLNPKYENIPSAQAFFNNFTEIRYNRDEDFFEFVLDYTNFKTPQEDYQKKWVLCTHGEKRFFFQSKDKPCEKVNVTQRLKDLFDAIGIDYATGRDIKAEIVKINTAEHLKTLLWLLKLTLSLRHSNSATGEDFILSPVRNAKGEFFNSSLVSKADGLPCDADANGAYHIALKGLCMMKQIDAAKTKDKLKLEKLDHHQWFKFVQTRHD